MSLALGVTFTILGLIALGRELAAAAPAGWRLGELVLFAAFVFVVRDYIGFRDAVKDIRRSPRPLAGSRPDTHALGPHGFGAQDFVPAASATRIAATDSKLDGIAEIRADDSVEHIAQVMLTQSFRKVSLKYHPDHGGDPEIMRRVYEARELMLRAIRKD